MSGVSKGLEDDSVEAGTSSMMETTMMEGEDYYHPEEATAWTEKVATDQLCRVCANPNEYLIPIYDGEGIEHQLGMKIEKHLPIHVSENDKLPLQVCYQCASTIIAWHDLVISCVEAEKKLRQLHDQDLALEEEEEDGDKGAPDFYDEPLDNEPTEDPIQPSTSSATVTSSATKITRSSPKKIPSKQKMVTKKKEYPSKKTAATKAKEEVNQDTTERSPPPVLHASALPLRNQYSVWIQTSDVSKNEYHLCDVNEVVIGETDSTIEITDGVNSPVSILKNTMDLKPTSGERRKSVPVFHRGESSSLILKPFRNSRGKYKLKRIATNQLVHCSYCNAVFRDNAVLQTHVRFHTMCSPFCCKFCLKQFKLSSSLKYHSRCCSTRIGALIVERIRYNCSLCSKSFTLKATLKEHLRSHSGNGRKRFICKVCGERFQRKPEFLCHITKHEGAKLFECDSCEKKFLSEKDLLVHKIGHSVVRQFQCLVCQSQYKHKSHLTRHNITYPNGSCLKPRSKINQLENWACVICEKIYSRKSSLLQHQLTHTHERKFSCHLCDTVFVQRGGLMRHMTTVHEGARNYVCEECDQRFTAKSSLQAHLLIHTGVKNHQCPDCLKSFRLKQQLTLHIQSVHTQERPFSCTLCPKAFKRKPHLVLHLRTHTGEKPYKCLYCVRAFAQKNDMNKHILTHSG